MRTDFPNLSFTNRGSVDLHPSGTHSAAIIGARTYLRTDLKTLTVDLLH